MTRASRSAEPELSVTVPLTAPVGACARTGAGRHAENQEERRTPPHTQHLTGIRDGPPGHHRSGNSAALGLSHGCYTAQTDTSSWGFPNYGAVAILAQAGLIATHFARASPSLVQGSFSSLATVIDSVKRTTTTWQRAGFVPDWIVRSGGPRKVCRRDDYVRRTRPAAGGEERAQTRNVAAPPKCRGAYGPGGECFAHRGLNHGVLVEREPRVPGRSIRRA